MTILKILGPSGAGKTSVVRTMFGASDLVTPVTSCGPPGTKLKTVGYTMGHPPKMIYVPGSYESNCGGVDTIGTAQQVMDDVDGWADKCDVIFEGLLQSTYYGKMGGWSKRYGQDFIYVWLNTPLEVCMARLQKRREENGTTRALNVPQAEAKWASVKAAFDKANVKGHRCEVLQWDAPIVPQIEGWLK